MLDRSSASGLNVALRRTGLHDPLVIAKRVARTLSHQWMTGRCARLAFITSSGSGATARQDHVFGYRRESISTSARRAKASPPAGRPGLESTFHAIVSTCAQGVEGETKRSRKSAAMIAPA